MKLIDKLPKVKGTYRENVFLSKTNWFGVGGPAEILFRPEDSEDLAFFLKNKPQELPVQVIGVGSNLIVRDGGVEGVVIKLGRGFVAITHHNNIVEAGAGALSYNVSVYAKNMGLSGLEFLSGIPGTIGGNLAMNAGAYGSDVSLVLEKAEAIDELGNFHILSPSDIGFIYRGTTLPEGWVFTKGYFKTENANIQLIEQKMADINTKREATQPIRSKTSGSTFKNPLAKKAWELIDQAGCRGFRIGGAIVSEKHCNFLINEGDATASDIENLGEEVRRRVKEKTGEDLEWEIKIIGKR